MPDMLTTLKTLKDPIKVVIIGTGSAGTGLVYQAGITPGIECVALGDICPEKAIDAAKLVNRPHVVVDSLGDLHDAIAKGLLPVCANGELLAQCDMADVVIDASSSIEAGGRFALTAIENGKHIVMMNAEADLIFGPYLMHMAHKNNVVYTSCDGDQPGVIRRMIDDLRLWGFELVMAGNIKGFLDRYTNPTKIAPEADKRDLDHKMCSSYTDGSKVCVEMALVANAFDLKVDVPGMNGPRMGHILDLPNHFELDRIHREHGAVVDYVLGPVPKGGVFAVGYTESKYQQHMLDWFPAQLGDGPYYIFRRPYHLIHIESMRCIAEAHLNHDALLEPTYGFKTNVFSYAKKDLSSGESLDGLGGYTCYGMIDNCQDDRRDPGVPICLADNVTLKHDIPKDQKIRWTDIEYDPHRFDFQLYEKAVRISESV